MSDYEDTEHKIDYVYFLRDLAKSLTKEQLQHLIDIIEEAERGEFYSNR